MFEISAKSMAASCIDEDHLNIFLEYVPGGSVTSLLRNYGAFEEPLVRNWVRQILTGLNYLHERDIIHRDIKGANMLVDNKGGIKISDFGISKKAEDSKSLLSLLSARAVMLKLLFRPSSRPPTTPAVSAGFRILDGARSRQANRIHQESRYLEYRMFGRGNADWRASLGTADTDASHFQGSYATFVSLS